MGRCGIQGPLRWVRYTTKWTTQNHYKENGAALGVFFLLFSLPDRSLRLPWDRSDGLVKRVGCRFKFRLWQHDFHHPNHVKENVAMFGVFWVVSGHWRGLQENQKCNSGSLGMDELRILTRGGYRYELRLGNMILNFQSHARDNKWHTPINVNRISWGT